MLLKHIWKFFKVLVILELNFSDSIDFDSKLAKMASL